MFLYVIFKFHYFFRDEEIHSEILRVVKIWEKRRVYDHCYLADLTGLLTTQNQKLKLVDPVQSCQVRIVLKYSIIII